MIEKSEIIVNGKKILVDRILKDGFNFIKIRDIANILNLEISNQGNIPVLNKKE